MPIRVFTCESCGESFDKSILGPPPDTLTCGCCGKTAKRDFRAEYASTYTKIPPHMRAAQTSVDNLRTQLGKKSQLGKKYY